MAQGGRSEEPRGFGVAARRAGKQAGRWRRSTNGAGTLHACGYDVRLDDGGMAGIAQAGVAQAGVAQAGAARGAVGLEADMAHLGWRRVVMRVSLMEVASSRARLSLFSARSEDKLSNLTVHYYSVCGRSVRSLFWAAESDRAEKACARAGP